MRHEAKHFLEIHHTPSKLSDIFHDFYFFQSVSILPNHLAWNKAYIMLTNLNTQLSPKMRQEAKHFLEMHHTQQTVRYFFHDLHFSYL